MDIGVFILINNNGWIISATSPQYVPSFDLSRRVVGKAEAFDERVQPLMACRGHVKSAA